MYSLDVNGVFGCGRMCRGPCVYTGVSSLRLAWRPQTWGSHLLSAFSCVQVFVTLWTVACQPLLSMGFSRQKYWSELPCPPPRDLPNPGMDPTSLTSNALAGGFPHHQSHFPSTLISDTVPQPPFLLLRKTPTLTLGSYICSLLLATL